MTDICSILSYHDIKRSGYLGEKQAMYLSVFSYDGLPLTHRQATREVLDLFKVILPERNGRIAELEAMGFIKKHDIVVCNYSHKKVNRWIWTGRRKPLPKREERIPCPHCDGRGTISKEVYYEPENFEQKRLF